MVTHQEHRLCPAPRRLYSGSRTARELQFWQSTANVSVHPFRRGLASPRRNPMLRFHWPSAADCAWLDNQSTLNGIDLRANRQEYQSSPSPSVPVAALGKSFFPLNPKNRVLPLPVRCDAPEVVLFPVAFRIAAAPAVGDNKGGRLSRNKTGADASYEYGRQSPNFVHTRFRGAGGAALPTIVPVRLQSFA